MEKKAITIHVADTNNGTPAAMMVQVASQYESKIYVDCGNVHVNAKSIMGMMALDFEVGSTVEITADGSDEATALKGLEDFLTGAD